MSTSTASYSVGDLSMAPHEDRTITTHNPARLTHTTTVTSITRSHEPTGGDHEDRPEREVADRAADTINLGNNSPFASEDEALQAWLDQVLAAARQRSHSLSSQALADPDAAGVTWTAEHPWAGGDGSTLGEPSTMSCGTRLLQLLCFPCILAFLILALAMFLLFCALPLLLFALFLIFFYYCCTADPLPPRVLLSALWAEDPQAGAGGGTPLGRSLFPAVPPSYTLEQIQLSLIRRVCLQIELAPSQCRLLPEAPDTQKPSPQLHHVSSPQSSPEGDENDGGEQQEASETSSARNFVGADAAAATMTSSHVPETGSGVTFTTLAQRLRPELLTVGIASHRILIFSEPLPSSSDSTGPKENHRQRVEEVNGDENDNVGENDEAARDGDQHGSAAGATVRLFRSQTDSEDVQAHEQDASGQHDGEQPDLISLGGPDKEAQLPPTSVPRCYRREISTATTEGETKLKEELTKERRCSKRHEEIGSIEEEKAEEINEVADDASIEQGYSAMEEGAAKTKSHLAASEDVSPLQQHGSLGSDAKFEPHHLDASSSHPGGDEMSLARERGVACDICLLEYEVGDVVAWSRNPACDHSYHEDCITDWLLRKTTCPSCRQEYVVMPDEDEDDNGGAAKLQTRPELSTEYDNNV